MTSITQHNNALAQNSFTSQELTVNKNSSTSQSSINIYGGYASPPARVRLDAIKTGLDQGHPFHFGHQHNASRHNQFAALTLRTPTQQCRLTSNMLGEVTASTQTKGDRPVGFDMGFGQALKNAPIEVPLPVNVASKPVSAQELGASIKIGLQTVKPGKVDIFEFSVAVTDGKVSTVVPVKQKHVGRKQPFTQLVEQGARKEHQGPVKIIGVMNLSSGEIADRLKGRAYKAMADEGLVRAFVLDKNDNLLGELESVQANTSFCQVGLPSKVQLLSPRATLVNAQWQTDAEKLLDKAGRPPVKLPCTKHALNDVEVHPMSDVAKGKLLAITHIMTGIFEKHGIDNVLSAGSQLGYARTEDMIPWDDDVDLVVPAAQMGKILELRDEFKSEGILITPRYHGAKLSFLDDKQRGKDGTPYPFVDLFAISTQEQGDFGFEENECYEKWPCEELPPNVFERSSVQTFGPKNLNAQVRVMNQDTALQYLNRVYGKDSAWDQKVNIINEAYTHDYDHDTGASKVPEPLNVTRFVAGNSPASLPQSTGVNGAPRALEKPLTHHPKYLPEVTKHLQLHQKNWQVSPQLVSGWSQWVADLPSAAKRV